MMTQRQSRNLSANDNGRDVAQPSPAASSRTVPVRESGSHDASDPNSGSGTPLELAAGTAALHDASDPLVSGFHFRGVLPHLKKEGGTYFVTFREAGTLPKDVLSRFKHEREAILRQALAAKRPLTWHEQEELFRWYSNRVDKYLDAGHGECHLRRPEFAGLLAGAICFFERQRYELRAWVVMPNHAHVVVWPMPGHTLSDILHSWKSFTAHEINKLLLKKIVPFWQSESYEHLIRDDEDLHRCCHYTLMNPVTACLCVRPEDWKWSSAHLAQPSPAASTRTVPVRGAAAHDDPAKESGGGTPPELAGGDACATPQSP
jgi:REP element-mobilizing transposase RayT